MAPHNFADSFPWTPAHGWCFDTQWGVIDTEEQRSLVEVTFGLGALPFFCVPLSVTCDQLVELDSLWGREGRVLRERLLEAATPAQKLSIVEMALYEHLCGELALDPVVAHAASAFERGRPVSEVAREVGMAPKRFVRRFRQRVGLTPKRYSRLRRLQRLLGAIDPDRPVSWAEVARAHGYYDQAHFINDFHELTGITPTEYRARSAMERNHVPATAG